MEKESDDRAVLVGSVLAALILGQQAAIKVVRDALFLSSHPATRLPLAIMAASVAAIASAAVMSRLLSRHAPSRVLFWMTATSSVCLIAEWALMTLAPRTAAAALYLHVALFGGVMVSGFWSAVNERFDALAAKNAVARIAFSGSCGALVGGATVWAAARLIGVQAALPLLAGVGLAAATGIQFLTRPRAGTAPSGRAPTAESPIEILRRVSYLRVLGLVVACGAVADAILDYVFKSTAAATIRDPADLAAFFGVLSTSVALAGLAIQAGLSRRCVARLGLAGTVALRPAGVLVASLVGVIEPGLGAALGARGCHDVATSSLFRSGYEPLFTPLPESEKRPTKSVVDVAIDKLGNLVGSAVVLAVLAMAPLPVGVLYGCVAAVCLAALFLTPRLHRGYVATLEQNLQAGRVTIQEPEVLDGATRSALRRLSVGLRLPSGAAVDTRYAADRTMEAVVALRSGDPHRILGALATGPSSSELVGHMTPLLAREDVYRQVVTALRSVRPAPIGQLVDTLLDASIMPIVRLRVARVLRGLPDPRTADGLLLGLRDPRADVRAHCARALAVLARRDPRLRPAPEQVLGALDVELAESPRDADLDHVFTLIALALDRQSVRLALEALRGSEPGERGAALEYLANVLPPRVRDWLWPRLTNVDEVRRRSPEASAEASSAAVPIDRAALRVQLAADAVQP